VFFALLMAEFQDIGVCSTLQVLIFEVNVQKKIVMKLQFFVKFYKILHPPDSRLGIYVVF
uniref:hypothetical protein n=1 Tax=Pleomorphochaeta sp. DL1XJH-081 TaxID=3409690 RepID=UPI003BB70670